ncbi:MAG: radical SAM family heme chaperone HemW [Hyphomonadaceae bacterium]
MSDPGFGIYVHWPYCASICPYCDFNVRRDRGGAHSDLRNALALDMEAQAARAAERSAGSLFLGGGTPSLMRGEDVALLIEAARTSFGLAQNCEITLEANPEHHARFAELVGAGVTRLSLGVQALRTPALMMLGRTHSVRQALTAVEDAAKSGARVSIDLIYARDGQSTEEWADELREALALPIEHLSLYQLTIEAGTPFARAVARGRMHAADAERAADLFAATQEITGANGFPAYEISNYARNTQAQSAHNLVYWRGGAWAGIGPGAHGRLTIDGARTATRAHADPAAYMRAVLEKGAEWAEAERLSDAQRGDEYLLMGLRLAEGVDRERLERLRGRALRADLLTFFAAEGLVVFDARRLALTPKGRALADRIASELALA